MYTQYGGQGYGTGTGYERRELRSSAFPYNLRTGYETGGGMGAYGERSERGGSPSGYGQGPGWNERWQQERNRWDDRERREDRERWGARDRDREEWGREWGGQGFSGREGGWGGYGSYDRERGGPYERERSYDRPWDEQRNRGAGSPAQEWSGNWSGGPGYRAYGTYGSYPGYRGGVVGSQPGVHPQDRSATRDWSRPGPHAGRGPKGWQRSDERIREDVSERLADHPDIDASEIEVQVNNGEVTLSGTVDQRLNKRLAEDIAEGVSGVRDVHNQIRVHRGVWGSIKDTFTGESDEDTKRGASPPMHTITPK
jgi:hypothetical protein